MTDTQGINNYRTEEEYETELFTLTFYPKLDENFTIFPIC